jgi:hypothetical protein
MQATVILPMSYKLPVTHMAPLPVDHQHTFGKECLEWKGLMEWRRSAEDKKHRRSKLQLPTSMM